MIQVGRGIRMVSTKQDVGIGEEMVEDGPCVNRHVRRRSDEQEEEWTYEAFDAVTAELHFQRNGALDASTLIAAEAVSL